MKQQEPDARAGDRQLRAGARLLGMFPHSAAFAPICEDMGDVTPVLDVSRSKRFTSKTTDIKFNLSAARAFSRQRLF
jgi:hypothetical protein